MEVFVDMKASLASKDPNNRVLGPKFYNIQGIWGLKPYDLGPWTLRAAQGLQRYDFGLD